MDNTIYTSYLDKVTSSNIMKTTFTDIVSTIKSGHYAKEISVIRNEPDEIKRKELKRKTLPVFFPTLVFGSNYALDEQAEATSIVQFDVDTKDNIGVDFSALRHQIQAVPEILYVFTSPSGGLKFGIKTDFNRHPNEDEESLKSRYKTAYRLAEDYVSNHTTINFSYDLNMQTLKYSCYLSSDSEAYFNTDCNTFSVDDLCVCAPSTPTSTKDYDDATEEQVIELLSFIPNNLGNDERLPINLAVMSVLGNSALSLLESHWSTTDRSKLKADLNYQLNKINKNEYIGKVGSLVEAAKKHGYVPPRAKRLSNRINFNVEEVNHTFPELFKDTDINELLDDAIESDTSHLFRISTGSGKSVQMAEVLSEKERKDNYLLLCDTHENVDKHVARINVHFDQKTKTSVASNVTDPITIEELRKLRKYTPAYSNGNYSCAVAIKGKTKMCNRLNSNSEHDLAFKKENANYIPREECNPDDCYYLWNQSCDFYNQTDTNNTHMFGNIYVTHFNALYNGGGELLNKILPVNKSVTVNKVGIVKRCKPIKAIIVDENAVQYIDNGIDLCVIANDIVSNKSVTSHQLLIELFKAAYDLTSLDLSTDEIKHLPVIYGQELKSLLDNATVNFNVKKALDSYQDKKRKERVDRTGNPFPTKIDVYENVLSYLLSKDEKYLFGMRLAGIKIAHAEVSAGFVQGGIKRINNRFADSKFIYLDATMNLDLVNDAILQGKIVEKTLVDIKMSDDIKILQVSGISCSKSSLQKNGRISRIIEHAKKHIAEYGLQDKKGGLISFKKLKINDVVDENFVDTAAKLLWGDDYKIATGNQTRYFGNTRGYDEMQDCNYMILIGDYNLPSHVIESHFWNLYGEPADLSTHKVDHLNRMADGSCIKTSKKQHQDPRVHSIYEHSCTAELEQALGRGRLIYGEPKTILVYSSMPLGGNVVIASFIDPNDVFPRQVVDQETLDLIKEIGFVKNKCDAIIKLIDLTKDQWNKNKEDIIKNFLDAGFNEESFKYLKSKKYKTETYLVFDSVKFDAFKAVMISSGSC